MRPLPLVGRAGVKGHVARHDSWSRKLSRWRSYEQNTHRQVPNSAVRQSLIVMLAISSGPMKTPCRTAPCLTLGCSSAESHGCTT
jgi:hypothetical protein